MRSVRLRPNNGTPKNASLTEFLFTKCPEFWQKSAVDDPSFGKSKQKQKPLILVAQLLKSKNSRLQEQNC